MTLRGLLVVLERLFLVFPLLSGFDGLLAVLDEFLRKEQKMHIFHNISSMLGAHHQSLAHVVRLRDPVVTVAVLAETEEDRVDCHLEHGLS